MKVIIMAGGKGTRIRSYRDDIPKALIELNDKSVIEYQIDELIRNGFNDIVIVVGYLGDQIISHLSKKKFNANIEFYVEEEPIGTAGALFCMKEHLTEDFIVLNGDLIFSMDFAPLIDLHKKSEALATVVSHSNDHPYDSAVLVVDKIEHRILKWIPKDEEHGDCDNNVNAGIHVLSPRVFSHLDLSGYIDLERDVLMPLVKEKNLCDYYTCEYIKDMGTPKRRLEVMQDLSRGISTYNCSQNK